MQQVIARAVGPVNPAPTRISARAGVSLMQAVSLFRRTASLFFWVASASMAQVGDKPSAVTIPEIRDENVTQTMADVGNATLAQRFGFSEDQILDYMSFTYFDDQRYEAAAGMLAIRLRDLSAAQPRDELEILGIKADLAIALAGSGRVAAAEPLMYDVIGSPIRTKAALPIKLSAAHALANALRRRGDYKNSELVGKISRDLSESFRSGTYYRSAVEFGYISSLLQQCKMSDVLREQGKLSAYLKTDDLPSGHRIPILLLLSKVAEISENSVLARQYIEKAQAEVEKALYKEHPLNLSILFETARLAERRGDVAGATANFEAAIKLSRSIPGASGAEAAALSGLARVLAKTDRADENAGRLADLAIDRAIAAKMGQNSDAPAFVDRTTGKCGTIAPDELVSDHLDIMWTLSKTHPDKTAKFQASAFRTAQLSALKPTNNRGLQTVIVESSRDAALVEAVRTHMKLQQQLAEISQQALRAAASNSGGLNKFGQTYAAVKAQEEEKRLAIGKRFPKYSSLLDLNVPSLEAVQRSLRDDEAVLLVADQTDKSIVFSISASSVQWTRIVDGFPAYQAAVDRLRCQLDSARCAGTGPSTASTEMDARTFDVAAAYRLYETIVLPVEAALRGKKRVYFLTDGALRDLPLGLLLTAPPNGQALAAQPWLADRYAFTYVPALAGLLLRDEFGSTKPEALSFEGYGDPVLGANDAAIVEARSFQTASFGADVTILADPAKLRTMPSLPGTNFELTQMARYLRSPPETVHTGARATETAVKTNARLSKASVVAFATHAILPGELGSFYEPGLILTPPKSASADDDGVLTASEVVKLTFSADWMILSACNTASGPNGEKSKSLSALAQAFLYAGARSLLASNWRVADDTTAILTSEAVRLRAFNPGMSRGEALQAAMKIVRTGRRPDGSGVDGYDPSWGHPSDWASFIHIANFDE